MATTLRAPMNLPPASPAASAAAAAAGAGSVATSRRTWRDVLRVYAEPTALRMLLLGFAAGLPLLLVLGTLSFRLREAGIDRATIGYLSWVGLAYGFKWAWAPLVDRLALPGLTRWLGRRRAWLLLSQLVIIGGLVAMALGDPRDGLRALTIAALVVAFASATQDIALDAYRIESAAVEKQGALAAMYQTGYRLAMIWAGAGVLWIAASAAGAASGYQAQAWTTAYLVMAASMMVGLVAVLLAPEPKVAAADRSGDAALAGRPAGERFAAWLRAAVIGPFADFVQRYRWHALLLLALIATYRISDVVMGIMANPFYVDMGYTKEEVAAVSKLYGVVLAARGHDLTGLVFVISADNLSAGIASAAFIAYLSGLTNVAYSATQYALFSSVMLLLPKFIAGFSGAFVDAHGYVAFFHATAATAALGVPVLLLVWLAGRLVPPRLATTGDQGSPSQ
ncbi:MAG: AmpG family muropeptide MFS transporter [Burkholderiaceae bacterium]|nr:AmpG family muropeptide MFS transporter [Burkholderiaceae bacterium]